MGQKKISFLLGSGFSVPDGIKTVVEVSNSFTVLTEDKIYIHSDMSFIVLSEPTDLTRLHVWDEKFFIDFIDFYIKYTKHQFNYEDCYDFVNSFLRYNQNTEVVESFFKSFLSKRHVDERYVENAHSFLSRFLNYFNQYLAIVLDDGSYYEDATLLNKLVYDNFCTYVTHVIESGFVICVHSLNHDILFENLGSNHHRLARYYCDGFTEYNSPYVGYVHADRKIANNKTIHKSYKVHLEFMSGTWSKPLQLYKLHGSVDTYIADLSQPDLTRVRKDLGIGDIFYEQHDEKTGEVVNSRLFTDTYPDLLTGQTAKLNRYNEGHYQQLFDIFKGNLSDSDLLVVIGYGFKDDGINRIIEESYLMHGKKMIVIDVAALDHRLINHYNSKLVQKSVDKIAVEEWKYL